MVRPKKNPADRKENRLTLYLTKAENLRLESLARHLGDNKTTIVTRALEQYIKNHENPPETLQKAAKKEIQELEKDVVRGYYCKNNHLFFIDDALSAEPKLCPYCCTEDIGSIWVGVVKKGFED